MSFLNLHFMNYIPRRRSVKGSLSCFPSVLMVNFIVICVSLFRYVLISKTSTSSKAFDVGEVELLVDLQPRKIERGTLDLFDSVKLHISSSLWFQ